MESEDVFEAVWPHNGSRFITEEQLKSLNETDGSYLKSEPAISIFFLVCIAISTIVGIVGNILVSSVFLSVLMFDS